MTERFIRTFNTPEGGDERVAAELAAQSENLHTELEALEHGLSEYVAQRDRLLPLYTHATTALASGISMDATAEKGYRATIEAFEELEKDMEKLRAEIARASERATAIDDDMDDTGITENPPTTLH